MGKKFLLNDIELNITYAIIFNIMGEEMKNYIKLLRPKHYLKNILIFLPLVFSTNLLDLSKFTNCIFAFMSFCCLASVVYIINDINDIEDDKKHDIKKNRPIASGKVTIGQAIVIAFILFIFMCVFNLIAVQFKFNIYTWILLFLYLILNILYSTSWKNKPILDISILVSGFIIRIIYGAVIIGVSVSNWLYLTILSAAIFVVLGKRRNETIKQGTNVRSVLKYYNKEFLDKNMYVFLGLTIVFYSLWCIDVTTMQRLNNNLAVWTVPIVMFIFMRYSLILEGDSYGDPVDIIFSDRVLMALITIYSVFMLGIIYII